MVVRPAGILDAQGGMKFVGGLTLAYSGHIYADQLGGIRWDADCRAMTNFFIVADVDVGGLFGLQPEAT